MSRRPTTKRGLAKDWKCPACAFPNFAYKRSCHQCGDNSPYLTVDSKLNMRNALKNATGASDWSCAECGFTNYAWRKNCYNCKAQTTQQQSSATTTERAPWDWYCCMPGCEGILNFATRATCLRCSTPFSAQARIKAGVCGNCNKEPLIQTPLVPCGHRPMCLTCMGMLDKQTCPICQQSFE